MDKISAITIVINGMAITYQVGQGKSGDTKVIASIERIPGYEDGSGTYFPGAFLVKDKDGNKLGEISDNIPYVITYV